MVRSLIRSLIIALVVGAIYGGFVWGRTLGSGRHTHYRNLQPLSNLLSAARGGAAGDAGFQAPDSEVPPGDIYEEVLDHVQRDFVESSGEANPAHLTEGALSRMFAALDDPKTNYLDPEMRRAREDALRGRYHGIGAVLTTVKAKKNDVDYRYLTVVDVMPGSPAEKAGIQPGDRITEVGGHWVIAYSPYADYTRISKQKDSSGKDLDPAVQKDEFDKVNAKFKAGLTLTKALTQLTTGEDKPLKVTVERAGQAAPIKSELTTAITTFDPVDYRVEGNHIGYLRVRQFNGQATAEFEDALLNRATDLKGLVVDLRGNPGGVRATGHSDVDGYDSARRLIALLTKGGDVATIERRPYTREPLTVQPVAKHLSVPLIVLVDHGTANLSELTAAALHDAAKARVVGAHTFGDDVLQLFATFKSGAGVEMSTAHLLTAANVDLNKGIQPDIVVAPTGNDGSDAALQRALSALTNGA